MRSALWLSLLVAGCARETTVILEAVDAPTLMVIDEASRVQALDIGAGGVLRVDLDEGSHLPSSGGHVVPAHVDLLHEGPDELGHHHVPGSPADDLHYVLAVVVQRRPKVLAVRVEDSHGRERVHDVRELPA